MSEQPDNSQVEITSRSLESGPEDGPRNLGEVEVRIEKRMNALAHAYGAQYISPTEDEIAQKITETISINPYIYYDVDERGNIWSPGGQQGMGARNVEAYNRSGKFGFIAKEREKDKEQEETVRVYRGGKFNPSIPQVAPLARVEGITVQDILEYVEGNANMDSIVEKAQDEYWKESLARHLQQIRERAERYGVSELEEILHEHTAYTSNAIGVDLWVSAAKTPEETYGSGNLGNVYGDFLYQGSAGLEIEGVMVLDVPKKFIQDYSSEVGILGEIKPEWISAIIPRSGDKQQMVETVRKVEDYIDTKNV